jgi:DNA repair exonuclease SbcCD ATPase subunit/DNA repair exonuclease SbcCD nuclease subunit
MRKSKRIKYDGTIEKIYHIADVHIRNLKRHKEYREVFNHLYEYISSTMNDKSIIVLCGDIVHAKTDMTPEVIEMTQTFLKSLSDMLPTILIPGNHDANLNNPNRLDALSPIVNALNHPNLHYLKDDGVWKMGGISFSHSSVFGDVKEIIPAEEVHGDYKIALYHAPVDKVKTEYGFQLENKNVKVDSFDGYDLVLLGDIHVPNQSLNDEGTIKYCGSTIMQNHAEAKYPEHGILVWDIETKESEFVPIHNDYGYVTLDVENGKLIGNPTIPNKPRMRVRVKDTSQSQLKKIISEVKVGRKVQELTIQKVLSDRNDSIGDSNITLQNVRDIGFQNKMMEKYLSDKYIIADEQMEVIRNINQDINNKLGGVHGMKNIIWKPKTFEFSNMFSYGTNNVVDFSQMKGAYGIFAPNASGKSSLWDALSFCLFDKCSRTNKALDVLNYSKSKFDCKFNFEINGIDYFIERVGKKSPKRGTVKVDVNFYRINEDGSTESLNGEERRDTNSIIRQYVGSYEDFILTAMSNQSNSGGFIEKSQREKKELLAQFLDMNVFEELYQIANDEIRELSALLKDYKNQNFTDKLVEAKEDLQKNEKVLIKHNDKLSKLKDKRNELRETKDNLVSELKPVDDTIIDTDSLKELKKELKVQIIDKSKECNGYVTDIETLSVDLDKVSGLYQSYDLNILKDNHLKYQSYVGRLEEITHSLDSINTDIEHKQEHLDGIGSLTFDDDCEHCVKNQNTPFAKKSKTLSDDIEKLKLKSNRLGEEIIDMKSEMFKYDVREVLVTVQELKSQSDDLSNKIEKLELTNKSCNLELSELKSKLDSTEDNINKSLEQKASVKHNTKIQQKIDKTKDSLDYLDIDISDLNDDIIDINGDIRISQNMIQTVNDSIDKLEFMEQKYEGYEYYLQCVRRDGIPYELISEILPKLEVEINNILQPIVDFQILLNTDGKNINSYIAYGTDEYWPLELTSGMEKFISSVAIRTALVNVSNLPRPNFIAIDEGFGSLDTDNFNSLYLLFDYLKNQFDFIVTISHIDKTRDMVDQIIDITKLGGFSSIRYL